MLKQRLQLSITLRAVYFYMSPEPLLPENRQLLAEQEKAAQAQGDTSPHDIEPEAREFLQHFYRPYNQRLADMLDDPNFTWGY